MVQEYYIVVPMILLHIISATFPIPINVIEPLEGVWDWKKFESFDAKFDAVKVFG